MNEEFDVELALRLSESLCRSGMTELSDIVYVAGRLMKAEDLDNVRPGIELLSKGNYQPSVPTIVVKADYVGPEKFWKYEDRGSPAEEMRVKRLINHFEDLGKRTGLEFMKLKEMNAAGPDRVSKGYKPFSLEILAPSGKPLNIIVTQYYTLEQERTT